MRFTRQHDLTNDKSPRKGGSNSTKKSCGRWALYAALRLRKLPSSLTLSLAASFSAAL
jgi:hypothetical protein